MNIHMPRRLPKPSTLLATAALVVATGGTAVAAGPIITDPSQIAPGVITGLHIKQQTVTKFDLDDPYLKIKVNSNGTVNGARNDTGFPGVQRVSKGVYDVTFNSTTINGSDGSSEESLLSKNCALSAQARSKLALSVVDGPTTLRPDTVRVEMSMIDPTGKTNLFGAVDSPFDLIAVC